MDEDSSSAALTKKAIASAAHQLRKFLVEGKLLMTFDLPQSTEQGSNTCSGNRRGITSRTTDYIAFNPDFARAFVDTKTLSHIDNGHVPQNHFLSVASFSSSLPERSIIFICSRKIPPQQLQDKPPVAKVQELLCAIPSPVCCVPLDVHYDRVVSAVPSPSEIA